MAKDDTKRALFVESAVNLMKQYNFNGLDIDWEYPIVGPQFAYSEKKFEEATTFLQLLKDLRAKLDEEEAKSGEHYSLSIAVSAAPQNIQDLPYEQIHQYLDHINLMSYDLDGAFDDDTGHQSPLAHTHGNIDPDAAENGGVWTSISAVEALLAQNVPSEKIVLGLPIYGRQWKQVATGNLNGLFENGSAGQGEWEAGVLGYNCIMGDTFSDAKESEKCQGYDATTYSFIDAGQGYHKLPDNGEVTAVGYVVNGKTFTFDKIGQSYYYNPNTQIFITYDTPTMTKIKTEYIKRKNLGGGMFWDLSGDAPEGANFPSLITTIYNGFNQ